MGVKRTVGFMGLVVVSLALTACSSPTSGNDGTGSWSAPEPPAEFASGLTIGFIPEGFAFLWNEGHETATFHVFQSTDASSQFAVGRQIAPEPYPFPGENITRNGRSLTVVEGTRETRVLTGADGDVRVEVVSRTLDSETLLRIAASVDYEPDLDR